MTTLTSPHDLLAAIPFLVGFKPENSIILISIKEESVSMAMRIDFPDSLDDSQVTTLIGHLKRDVAEAVLSIYYLPDQADGSDSVISTLTQAIERENLVLRESIIVTSGRWRSLLCQDQECCPDEGSPMPNLHDSRIAAEQVASGKPLPYDTIDELDPLPQQRVGAAAIVDFITDFQADGLCRDKKIIALVLVRLLDLQVRDFALGSVTEESLHTYFSAWRWLMRIAPQGYLAPAATLFAAVAYERGDGALAQRALDRVETDDPDYAMLRLFREVFSRGWSPDNFAAMRAELHPKICDSLFSGTMNV
jgi:hypothetical protein